MTISYAGFAAFYDKTCRTMTPGPMPTADPDIADFRDRGHKILMWHGWADGHIMHAGRDRQAEPSVGGAAWMEGTLSRLGRRTRAPHPRHTRGGGTRH